MDEKNGGYISVLLRKSLVLLVASIYSCHIGIMVWAHLYSHFPKSFRDVFRITFRESLNPSEIKVISEALFPPKDFWLILTEARQRRSTSPVEKGKAAMQIITAAGATRASEAAVRSPWLGTVQRGQKSLVGVFLVRVFPRSSSDEEKRFVLLRSSVSGCF